MDYSSLLNCKCKVNETERVGGFNISPHIYHHGVYGKPRFGGNRWIGLDDVELDPRQSQPQREHLPCAVHLPVRFLAFRVFLAFYCRSFNLCFTFFLSSFIFLFFSFFFHRFFVSLSFVSDYFFFLLFLHSSNISVPK